MVHGGTSACDPLIRDGRSADEAGLVIELLKHAPGDLLTLVLQLFNTFLFHGDVPSSWRKTVFTMRQKANKHVMCSDRLAPPQAARATVLSPYDGQGVVPARAGRTPSPGAASANPYSSHNV